jgi:hypothetical protein
MHDFVVETIRQPVRLRALLETREHLNFRTDRIAIKIECFFTTAAEEEIRLN